MLCSPRPTKGVLPEPVRPPTVSKSPAGAQAQSNKTNFEVTPQSSQITEIFNYLSCSQIALSEPPESCTVLSRPNLKETPS
jgi:hypothetical protein